MLPHAFQRIVIEEAVAAKRHARNDPIVESTFQYILVSGVARGKEHAVVPVHVGDGGASFAIGCMVVQFIIRAEAFALGTGSDTAGEVQFAPGHVFPNARKGMEISRVAGQCGHVGHTGIQVTGPHGMPHYFILFENGFVVLAVCAGGMSVGASSRFFHEIPGRAEVFFFSGDFVQLG